MAASWGGGVAWFDVTTDQATLLYGKCYTLGLEDGMESMIQSRKMIVNPAFHCPPMLDHPLNLNSATFIAGDWICAAGRHGRARLQPHLAEVRPGGSSAVPAPGPARLQPLRMLPAGWLKTGAHGGSQGLWAVTLTTEDPQPKTARTLNGYEYVKAPNAKPPADEILSHEPLPLRSLGSWDDFAPA